MVLWRARADWSTSFSRGVFSNPLPRSLTWPTSPIFLSWICSGTIRGLMGQSHRTFTRYHCHALLGYINGNSQLCKILQMYSFVGVTSVTFAIAIVFVLLFESPFMHLQKLLVGGKCLFMYFQSDHVQSWTFLGKQQPRRARLKFLAT